MATTTRFDQFTAHLGRPHTRRGALRLLGAAVLGGGGLALGRRSTAAASRQLSINQSNDFLFDCLANGGEPDADVDDRDGFVEVSCLYPDGHVDYCFYFYTGRTDCASLPAGLSRPAAPPQWVGGTIKGDHSLGGNANTAGPGAIAAQPGAVSVARRGPAKGAGSGDPSPGSSHASKQPKGHKRHGHKPVQGQPRDGKNQAGAK
jgi:hypothetical protein